MRKQVMTLRPRRKLVIKINRLEKKLYAENAYVARCKLALIKSLRDNALVIFTVVLTTFVWGWKRSKGHKIMLVFKELGYILLIRLSKKLITSFS